MTEKNYLRNDLDTHVMTESKSRSFNFRRADGSSFYFFNITWSAGKISLSGDIGNIVLYDVYAMPSFETAVQWAATSEIDYLLGKSEIKKQYQPKETADLIISNANAPVIEAINGIYDTNYIRDPQTGKYVLDKRRLRVDGMRQQKQELRRGEIEEWQVEDIYIFEKKEHGNLIIELAGGDDCPYRYWSFCDCWEKWVEIWKSLDDFGRYSNYSNDKVKNVLKSSYRANMRDAVYNACYTQDEAAALMCRLGYDDFPIVYDYSFNARRLAAAIRWACQRLIAEGVVPAERAAA